MGNVPAIKFFVVNGGDVLIKIAWKAADYAAMLDIENSLKTISHVVIRRK